MNAAQKVANSIRNNVRFSALCFTSCRGDTGTSKAIQAFRLQARRHHHVRPVAHQVVYRCRQRMHAAFELCDQVFLIAAVVGREHHILGGQLAIIGDVEEVAILLEQPHLALVDPQALAEDDHAIGLLAGNGTIVEFGDHLFEQVDRLEAALFDDLRLDPFGLLAGEVLMAYRGGRSRKLYTSAGRSSARALREAWQHDLEEEADVAGFVPAIEMLGLAIEVGERMRMFVWATVSPRRGNPPKAALAAQGDRLVQVDVGLLVRGTVATAIEQVQRLGGVGQRDEQGLIAPVPFVVDVDALLTLGVGRNHRAIGIDDRFVEELGRLLGPDAQPRPINEIHQVQDVGYREAAAEIADRGRVWDTLGSDRIEVDHIVAPQFQVFDALAADKDIEGDVQDMVGVVVWQVSFEKMEVVVDFVDEIDLLNQQQNGADTAGTEAPDATRRVRSGYWSRSSWVQAAPVRAYWPVVS